jgi:hypothetical protein
MSVLSVIILFIIFVSVIFDAYRDSWVHRKPEIGWLRWHLVKWVSFFSPLILLSYFYFRIGGLTRLAIAIFLIFAAICYVVWRMIYRE